MKKLTLTFVLLAFIFYLKSQKAVNYSIYVEFFPKNAKMGENAVSPESFMRGNTKVILSEIKKDTVAFYLHGEFMVDSILSGNRKINFQSEPIFYDEDYSYISLKTNLLANEISGNKLSIYYSGFFNPSRVRSLSDYMQINSKAGVYLRSFYYSLWFPVFIEPGSEPYSTNFENVTIILPDKFKCVVTGKLMKETIQDRKLISVWKPGLTNIINVQCTAREYKVLEKNNVYVYHLNNQEPGKKIIDFTVKLKELFAKTFMNVPDTNSLYIMEMPEYGLISSGNVIGLTTPIFTDFDSDEWSKMTVTHEMIHPYVQIPILYNNNFYALVIEGFPSFFPYYAFKRLYGDKFNLKGYMKYYEESYLKKKKTGEDRWGKLPKERPLLEIKPEQIGEYKDRFVLGDRVHLFFYHLWNKMGDKKFDNFLEELFKQNSLDYKSFEMLVLKYVPTYKNDLNIWLATTDYPEEMKIKN